MDEPDPAVWLPHGFSRVPERRWVRAVYLADAGKPCDPRVDDAWVARAVDAVSGRGGPASRAAAVRTARRVWAGGPAARGHLEARLLTTEPLAEVARRCDLPAPVVRAYERVFFAVRPVRRVTDWHLVRAVGYSGVRGFTGPLPMAAWKLAAVAGGPLLLDVVRAATTGGPLPDGAVAGTGPAREYARARLRLLARLWVGIMGAESPGEIARLAAAHARLSALDDSPGGRTASAGSASGVFLDALPDLTRPAGHGRGNRGRSRSGGDDDGHESRRRGPSAGP